MYYYNIKRAAYVEDIKMKTVVVVKVKNYRVYHFWDSANLCIPWILTACCTNVRLQFYKVPGMECGPHAVL